MMAFVHIEKCGGTSLIHLFRRYFALDHFDMIPRDDHSMLLSPDDLRFALKLRPGLRSIAGHSIRLHSGLEQVSPEIFYITTLREPIARYISDFRHFVD